MTYPLDKLCAQIFKYDRRIRYASVLDDTGRIVAGGMRKGISSLEPLSEDLRLMANLTIQIGTDKTWDRYFGNIQYTFLKREKVNMVEYAKRIVKLQKELGLAQAKFPELDLG